MNTIVSLDNLSLQRYLINLKCLPDEIADRVFEEIIFLLFPH